MAYGRLSELAAFPLVADGPMGTELLPLAGDWDEPLELLNLARPELVLSLHRRYAALGSRLLLSNTFGATPERLGVRCAEANRAGLRLAREAAQDQAIVGGSIAVDGSRDSASYAAQAKALLGADVLVLETAISLEDARSAISAVGSVSLAPLILLMSFDDRGLLHGLTPADVAEELSPLELDAFGCGCGMGPVQAMTLLAEMRRAAPDAVLVAKPSAGIPIERDGTPEWPATPEQFAMLGRRLRELGIQIAGACCGATTEHLQALGAAFRLHH